MGKKMIVEVGGYDKEELAYMKQEELEFISPIKNYPVDETEFNEEDFLKEEV